MQQQDSQPDDDVNQRLCEATSLAVLGNLECSSKKLDCQDGIRYFKILQTNDVYAYGASARHHDESAASPFHQYPASSTPTIRLYPPILL